MKERAIIYLVHILVGISIGLIAYTLLTVCGCEKEEPFTAGMVETDTVFGFSEPNEASYKAWFGWE